MKKTRKTKKASSDDLPETKSKSQVIINIKPDDEKTSDELPGYEKTECEVCDTSTECICWNCCHTIDNLPISQPLLYGHNVFTTCGNFCSYACIGRYIIDSKLTREELFTQLSLLNLFVNKSNNTYSDSVVPAPSRLCLRMFGGNMSIDDYRRDSKEYITMTHVEPIVQCVELSETKLPLNKKTIQENKKEFKLYRRNKKTTTNDIYASMNLISNG